MMSETEGPERLRLETVRDELKLPEAKAYLVSPVARIAASRRKPAASSDQSPVRARRPLSFRPPDSPPAFMA